MLLESVDGRPHLEQARPVFQARKPVFIDKPVAGSLADAIAIFELARETGTPCFSSSSLRFSPGIAALKNNPKVGEILGCDAYGPCALEEHHPDLFWYGIHGVETPLHDDGDRLRVGRPDADRRDRRWSSASGRAAGSARSAACARSPTSTAAPSSAPRGSPRCGDYGGYEPLVVEIVKFFKTGKPPVTAEETIEIFAFMEAADESKRQGGQPVSIARSSARPARSPASDIRISRGADDLRPAERLPRIARELMLHEPGDALAALDDGDGRRSRWDVRTDPGALRRARLPGGDDVRPLPGPRLHRPGRCR